MARTAAARVDLDDDDTDHAPPVQRTVSAANSPRPVTTGAPSVFAAAKSARPGPRVRTPLPDPDAVVIRRQVPIPPATRGDLGKRISAYAAIWDKLAVGDCVELPDAQCKSLCSWAKKQGHKFVVRKLLTPGMRGVWRVA